MMPVGGVTGTRFLPPTVAAVAPALAKPEGAAHDAHRTALGRPLPEPQARMPLLSPKPPAAEPLARRLYAHIPGWWTPGLEAWQQRRHGRGRAAARLDVMTSVGGKDLDVLQVLLQSLSETHPRDRIVFWLFYLRYSEPMLRALEAFCDGLPNLTLKRVPVREHDDFALLSKLGGKPYGARFLWFAAHRYLPEKIRRVIYLDPLDTLVTDDLVPFLTQPLLGRYLAACREAPFRPPVLAGPARRGDAAHGSTGRILRISKGVMNSGSIVINLDRMRQDGLGIEPYLATARWAHDRMGLTFGDQGLFSLTHGSHYLRAHDRYNFRFHDAPPGARKTRPAVVHFAGRIAKPFHLRLSAPQETRILAHLRTTGQRQMALTPHQVIAGHDLAYYRLWWDVCARTPVHRRISPLAEARATEILARQLPAPA